MDESLRGPEGLIPISLGSASVPSVRLSDVLRRALKSLIAEAPRRDGILLKADA